MRLGINHVSFGSTAFPGGKRDAVNCLVCFLAGSRFGPADFLEADSVAGNVRIKKDQG